jgi:hypothetical protein
MNLKFTKLAFTDALLSLIPIFPAWTILTGLLAAESLRAVMDCEQAYLTTAWVFLILALYAGRWFVPYLLNPEIKWTDKEIKKHYRLFNLIIYTLINYALFIKIVSPNTACYGQSDSALSVIYSGPLTSLILLLAGLLIDITRKIMAHNNGFSQ